MRDALNRCTSRHPEREGKFTNRVIKNENMRREVILVYIIGGFGGGTLISKRNTHTKKKASDIEHGEGRIYSELQEPPFGEFF